MKDILNARVKHREAFRPFAPVIPLENISEVFEQDLASPCMLLVPRIKPKFHENIPAITHVDGTGRVQTVTKKDNAYFYQLCHKLVELRNGPPVLLNTSFNVAGQPIVETAEEAIETFLSTDIDYLALENCWISKRKVPVLSYEEHLKQVAPSEPPQGLPPGQLGLNDLMNTLDKALFFGETRGCPWADDELKKLSSIGGLYKETSLLFPAHPFYGNFGTQLSHNVVLLLDPLGNSSLVDLTHRLKPASYSFEEVKLLMAVLKAPKEYLEDTRMELCLTNLEFEKRVHWAMQQLSTYDLKPEYEYGNKLEPDVDLPITCMQTFEPFKDEKFSARYMLVSLNDCLRQAEYTEKNICSLLNIKSLQEIEPTHLFYYDKYVLPQSTLGDLIRIFLLRSALPKARLKNIFKDKLFSTLISLGLLIPRGKRWSSLVDIYYANGLYLATDHRFMIMKEDRINEDPVMYIGMDSMGLVHTVPQYKADQVLDLCCGAGIQGLLASRYSGQVTAIDINPRAVRFTRFNAQLNGIRNISVHLGNLYKPVLGKKFDTILANPPFVPSPKTDYRFRDGGDSGEKILSQIIEGSAVHLTSEGRLFIVSDLVDVQNYEQKLHRWWKGGAAHKLVLQTADRNDLLFSVPHSHSPFGQSFDEYNNELDLWIQNLNKVGISSVNFGYILISRFPKNKEGSYYSRTIHNPLISIHQYVMSYFLQRKLLEDADSCSNKFLILSHGLYFRIEANHDIETRKIEIFSPDNPYFTTYRIGNQLYRILQDIDNTQPQLGEYLTPANKKVLFDLIYKGILYLGDKRVNPNENQRHKEPQPELFNVLSITELETKTTPTCLSSYLL